MKNRMENEMEKVQREFKGTRMKDICGEAWEKGGIER